MSILWGLPSILKNCLETAFPSRIYRRSPQKNSCIWGSIRPYCWSVICTMAIFMVSVISALSAVSTPPKVPTHSVCCFLCICVVGPLHHVCLLSLVYRTSTTVMWGDFYCLWPDTEAVRDDWVVCVRVRACMRVCTWMLHKNGPVHSMTYLFMYLCTYVVYAPSLAV